MGTKLTVTIDPDTDYLKGNQVSEAMAKTLAVLGSVVDIPTGKIALTINCSDLEADLIRLKLQVALSGRPVGINATLKTQTEEYVAVKREPKKTPMDDVIDAVENLRPKAGEGVDRVEFRANGRTVVLEPR